MRKRIKTATEKDFKGLLLKYSVSCMQGEYINNAYELCYLDGYKAKKVEITKDEFKLLSIKNGFLLMVNNSDGTIYDKNSFKNYLDHINNKFIKKQKSILNKITSYIESGELKDETIKRLNYRYNTINSFKSPLKSIS